MDAKRVWTPYVSYLKWYPTVMYVDRGYIRYRPYRDERWNPRFVGVTAVLVRGLRDDISVRLVGLQVSGRYTVLDAIRYPL